MPNRGADAHSPEVDKKAETLVAAGVLLGALAVRLAGWFFWRGDPLHEIPLLDAAFFHELAAGTAPIASGPLLWNPLYPFFLKILYSIAGPDPGSALLVQMGLGAVGAELAYLCGRMAFGLRAPALAGAALTALYGPFLFHESILLGTSLAVFLVWMFLWLSLRAAGRPAPWGWIPPGLALGAAGLLRPTVLLVLPVLAVWLFFRDRSRRGLRRLGSSALLIAGTLLPLLPSLVHNARHGVLQPVALHGGINFYIGNRHGASGSYDRPFPGPHGLRGQRTAALGEAGARSGRRLDWAEADRFWFREGLREILEDPAAWGALIGRKTGLLLNDYEIPLNYNYDFFRHRSVFFSLPWPGFALVLSLAAAGFALALKDRLVPWPAVLFFGAGAAGTILFFVTSRYRMPLLPPLVLLGGYGISEGLGALLAARLSRFSLAAAAAAAAAVPALYPVERTDFSGSWRSLGDVYRTEGRWVEALRSYDSSIDVRPNSAAWNNLGTVLLKFKGSRGAPEAADAFQEAIRLDEGNREAWNNLGVARKAEGDALAAETAFEAAIDRFPGYAKPVENLARLWADQGERESALDLVSRLARALEERGDLAGADAVRRRWKLKGR